MDIDLFAFLDGASPWWWIAFALALGAVEIVTFTYFMLWLGLGAVTVGVGLMLFPEMAGTTQLLAFGIFSLLYTGVGYAYVRRRQPREPEPALNRRAAALVGRQVVVSEPFQAGFGWVDVDGVRWRARLAEGAEPSRKGALVSVVATEGMTLIVGPAA